MTPGYGFAGAAWREAPPLRPGLDQEDQFDSAVVIGERGMNEVTVSAFPQFAGDVGGDGEDVAAVAGLVDGSSQARACPGV